jgi:hypothetical protein
MKFLFNQTYEDTYGAIPQCIQKQLIARLVKKQLCTDENVKELIHEEVEDMLKTQLKLYTKRKEKSRVYAHNKRHPQTAEDVPPQVAEPKKQEVNIIGVAPQVKERVRQKIEPTGVMPPNGDRGYGEEFPSEEEDEEENRGYGDTNAERGEGGTPFHPEFPSDEEYEEDLRDKHAIYVPPELRRSESAFEKTQGVGAVHPHHPAQQNRGYGDTNAERGEGGTPFHPEFPSEQYVKNGDLLGDIREGLLSFIM